MIDRLMEWVRSKFNYPRAMCSYADGECGQYADVIGPYGDRAYCLDHAAGVAKTILSTAKFRGGAIPRKRRHPDVWARLPKAGQ